MLARLLIIALQVWADSAFSLPRNGQLLQNVSSIGLIPAVPLNTSTTPTANGDCFSAPNLFPASYFDCLNAASSILKGIGNPHRPITFARKGKAGVILPRTARDGTCVISLDVADDDERDQFQPWAAYTAAVDLATECLGHDPRLGGKRTIGPKNVVGLILFGREGQAGNGDEMDGGELVLEMSNSTAVDGGGTHGDALEVRNISSLDLARQPLMNSSTLGADGMCFEMPKIHEIRSATDQKDCYQAADDMIKGKPRNILLTFSHNPNATFPLPATFKHGTCVIRVDTLNAEDEDVFELWVLYGAAVDVANRCTMSPEQLVAIWGGKRTAGLQGLVNVLIFGLYPSDVVAVPTISSHAHIVAKAQAKGKVPIIVGGPSLGSDSPTLEAMVGGEKPNLNTPAIILNGSSTSAASRLGGPLTCYDPPLPRERLYPLISSDCDKAADQIIGNRAKWDRYIFSRKPVTGFAWYQLPARFTYGTCVIFLDMQNDEDEDAVRLAHVVGSAWILGRKCSGEDIPQYKYGGYMTVSAGGADLISIHVYGRPSPPLTGQRPTLALSQTHPR